MAKITKQKCRKQITCSKCGEPIKVSEEYLKGTPFHRKPICRHLKCGLRSWELSNSDFVQTCGSLQDDWQSNYGIGEDTISDITSELEELRDNCQDSLDNMPESLQDSETGEMLQERIDNVESVISELENVTSLESLVEDYISDYQDEEGFDADDIRNNYDNLPDDIKDQFIEEVNDALSGLEY